MQCSRPGQQLLQQHTNQLTSHAATEHNPWHWQSRPSWLAAHDQQCSRPYKLWLSSSRSMRSSCPCLQASSSAQPPMLSSMVAFAPAPSSTCSQQAPQCKASLLIARPSAGVTSERAEPTHAVYSPPCCPAWLCSPPAPSSPVPSKRFCALSFQCVAAGWSDHQPLQRP